MNYYKYIKNKLTFIDLNFEILYPNFELPNWYSKYENNTPIITTY